MEFENKQFDGPIEIANIKLRHKGQTFNGKLYLPPKIHEKPYPLIIYLHGFPQLFSLEEIARNYNYLLNLGFAFLLFNYRGYKNSQGEISIKSHVSDTKDIIKFVEKMVEQGMFDLSNVNMIAHDFGAYISILTCSKVKFINKLVLLSPILDLKKHVNNVDFIKNLHYINRFLPGNVRGIEKIEKFVRMTKKELSKKEFQIEKAIKNLYINHLAVIHGEEDKVTPVSEVKQIFNKSNVLPKLAFVKSMEHNYILDDEMEEFNDEIRKFFE